MSPVHRLPDVTARALRVLGRPVAVASLIATTGLAAVEAVQVLPDPTTTQLRLWAGSPTTYDVEERIGEQQWTWDGERHTPGGIAVEGLWARITPVGGVVASLGLEVQRHDITPSRYSYAGVTFTNTSPNRLRATNLGLTLGGGWQYGLTGDWSRGNQLWAECGPICAIGTSWISSDIRDGNGGYSKSDGRGWYYRYGLRLGVYLSEGRVLGGVTVAYERGRGEADIDTIGDRTAELTYEPDGLTWGGVIGYAF
jgi:hypothetical protein